MGLPEVAGDARSGGGENHAAKALLGHDWPGSFGDLVRPVVVDAKNDVPVGIGHVLEGLVA